MRAGEQEGTGREYTHTSTRLFHACLSTGQSGMEGEWWHGREGQRAACPTACLSLFQVLLFTGVTWCGVAPAPPSSTRPAFPPTHHHHHFSQHQRGGQGRQSAVLLCEEAGVRATRPRAPCDAFVCFAFFLSFPFRTHTICTTKRKKNNMRRWGGRAKVLGGVQKGMQAACSSGSADERAD